MAGVLSLGTFQVVGHPGTGYAPPVPQSATVIPFWDDTPQIGRAHV